MVVVVGLAVVVEAVCGDGIGGDEGSGRRKCIERGWSNGRK